MIFDSHVHTAASPDSEMPPEEAILILGKQGLGCIFTEHVDYSPSGEPFFCADPEIYPRDYLKYRSESVKIGVELGLIAECVEINRNFAADKNYDYVLGSVHVTNYVDIGYDPDSFFKTGEETFIQHLRYILDMVKMNDFFDALGHIDYISRYSPFPEEDHLYAKYADIYDEILKELISRDKLLEFNTKRIDQKLARDNLITIYSRYKDLGGRYVTLGSDAHEAERLACNFDIAVDILNNIGLKPVYFEERRMKFC